MLAAGLLIADGLFCGLWTDRWQSSRHVPAAVASLDRVPMVIGEWKGQKLPDFTKQSSDQAGFAGYLSRRYENPAKGISVTVLLACGSFGPLSVHTPDICYAGSGFVQQGAMTLHNEELPVASGAAKFWTAKFARPDSLAPGVTKVCWGWNDGHGWQAPDNARLAFAGTPVLYKLYISRDFLDEKEAKTDEKTREFIQVFLPELEKALAFKP